MTNQLLNGHNDFDSAHLTEDYPYGFRLRCQRKMWIEIATKGAKKGEYRVMTCTSNPKTGGWNKPKAGQYDLLTILFINDEGHCDSDSINYYCDTAKCQAFKDRWYDQMCERDRKVLDDHLKKKAIVDQAFANGTLKFVITPSQPVNIFDL